MMINALKVRKVVLSVYNIGFGPEREGSRAKLLCDHEQTDETFCASVSTCNMKTIKVPAS